MVFMIILLHFDEQTGRVKSHAQWIIFVQIDTYNIPVPRNSMPTIVTPIEVLSASWIVVKCIVPNVLLILMPRNSAYSSHLVDVILFHKYKHINGQGCNYN